MSQNFVEKLRNKRYAASAVIAKLERARGRLPDAVFLIVESLPDRIVFVEPAKRILGDRRLQPILCDGKRGVLELLRYVRAKYGSDHKILFFVDRDHDDFLAGNPVDEQLYVTDGYSIESGVTTPEAVKVALTELYCLDDDEGVIDAFVAEYTAAVASYCYQSLPLMAWSIGVRRLGGRCNLNNINMLDVFDLTDAPDPRRRKRALYSFQCKTSIDLALSSACGVRPILREFRGRDACEIVRGKYLLGFFIRYLRTVKSRLQATLQHGERRHFMNVEITEDNVFQLLIGRLQFSRTLIEFFESVKGKCSG